MLLRNLLNSLFIVTPAKGLQRYATEFDFRWNHRKTTDVQRSGALLSQVGGKRLTYKRPDAEPATHL